MMWPFTFLFFSFFLLIFVLPLSLPKIWHINSHGSSELTTFRVSLLTKLTSQVTIIVAVDDAP